jgi:hypothetical protein
MSAPARDSRPTWTPPPKRGLPVRSHHWTHAVETGLLTGLLAFGLAVVRIQAKWPHWTPAAAVAGTGAVVVLVTAAASGRVAFSWYAAAFTTCVAGWEVACGWWSPWTQPMIVALAATVAVFSPFGVIAWAHHDRLSAADADAEARRRHGAELGPYADALDQAGFGDVTVLAVDRTRAGRIIRLRLPPSGQVTYQTLVQAIPRLEVALPGKLRHGSVRFEAGQSAALVDLHIIERDVLAETVLFPSEARQRSIAEPFPIGIREDGKAADVLFRQVAAMVIGLRGAGKTNLLNVLTAQLGWCTDAVIFAIDNKGGRFVRPWLEPWVKGDCPRPIIDWAATDRAEVGLMLEALLAGIHARARNLTGSKVNPTPEVPAIVLIVDEVAVIFGMAKRGKVPDGEMTNTQLATLGGLLTQLGRSEAVDPIWCTQRATVTMLGGGDLKSQCALRFGLGVATESDASSVFEDDLAAARLLSKLTAAGSVLMSHRDGKFVPMPVKSFRLDPDDDAARIYQIGSDTGWIRPGLDTLTAEAMGDAYAERWARPAARQLIEVVGGAAAGTARTVDGDFDDLVAQIRDPEAGMHPSRRRLRILMAERQALGISPAQAFAILKDEGREVARETIQRWFADDVATGFGEKVGHGCYRIRQSDDRGEEAAG